ncbi:MAG: hypothetical protein K2X27_14860 [Candidatus Obscuribacterales bacterium]|nr:hypothetical protein [Candidatus Obscuribacterales bacterium]
MKANFQKGFLALAASGMAMIFPQLALADTFYVSESHLSESAQTGPGVTEYRYSRRITEVPARISTLRTVERIVDDPVIVEKPVIVERVVDRPVYRDRIVEKPVYIERQVEIEKPVVVEKPVLIEKRVEIEKPVVIYKKPKHLLHLGLPLAGLNVL